MAILDFDKYGPEYHAFAALLDSYEHYQKDLTYMCQKSIDQLYHYKVSDTRIEYLKGRVVQSEIMTAKLRALLEELAAKRRPPTH